jgi:hypothetical protein
MLMKGSSKGVRVRVNGPLQVPLLGRLRRLREDMGRASPEVQRSGGIRWRRQSLDSNSVKVSLGELDWPQTPLMGTS